MNSPLREGSSGREGDVCQPLPDRLDPADRDLLIGNRLRRFEQLTGRSLTRPSGVVEISLAPAASRLLDIWPDLASSDPIRPPWLRPRALTSPDSQDLLRN